MSHSTQILSYIIVTLIFNLSVYSQGNFDVMIQDGLNRTLQFNPTTKISYSLPKSGFVKIVLYDVIGSEITTVVNDYESHGVHTVLFNGNKLLVVFISIKWNQVIFRM